MILGPDGQPISEVIREDEGIAYADLDLARCVVPKQFQDVVGYYNRFDVFEFKVNRRAHRPAHFHDDASDASDAQPTRNGQAPDAPYGADTHLLS
jgi:aliphatic nitrilase